MANGVAINTYGKKICDTLLDIQHRLNPLHVYCRCIEGGVNKRLSRSICMGYEILIYNWANKGTIIAHKAVKGLENLLQPKL